VIRSARLHEPVLRCRLEARLAGLLEERLEIAVVAVRLDLLEHGLEMVLHDLVRRGQPAVHVDGREHRLVSVREDRGLLAPPERASLPRKRWSPSLIRRARRERFVSFTTEARSLTAPSA
jgi:hypothetical protein